MRRPIGAAARRRLRLLEDSWDRGCQTGDRPLPVPAGADLSGLSDAALDRLVWGLSPETLAGYERDHGPLPHSRLPVALSEMVSLPDAEFLACCKAQVEAERLMNVGDGGIRW